MMTDVMIQKKGIEALIKELGNVDAERFINIAIKNPFDYTEWRKTNVHENISVRDLEDISVKGDIQKKVPINRQVKENEYQYIENALKDILGTRVKIENKKIEIFFDSKVDLTRILDILNVKID